MNTSAYLAADASTVLQARGYLPSRNRQNVHTISSKRQQDVTENLRRIRAPRGDSLWTADLS